MIELLSVVGLISLVCGISAPALRGLSGSGALDTGTRTLVDVLNAARSEAIAHHTLVRVVIAKDWTGDASANLRKVSVWSYNANAERFFQDTPWYALPTGVLLEPEAPSYLATASYAVTDGASVRGDFPLNADSQADDYLPPTADGTQITSRYIEYLPTGSARIAGGAKRNVILVATQGYLNGTEVVHTERTAGQVGNWAQINVDTLTGRARVYRP